MAQKRCCFWCFLNFKLVPVDLELNSALRNQIYFYQKCGSCTQKSNETWNLKIRVKIKKKHLWLKGYRWKVVGPKSLYIQDLRIHGSSVDFHSDPLNFDLAQIFTKKCSKSAKSSPIFHLKGRRDTSWLYGWIFSSKITLFKFDHLLQRGKVIKVGSKV